MPQLSKAAIEAVLSPLAKAVARAVENYVELAEQIYWCPQPKRSDLFIPENVLQTSIAYHARDLGVGEFRLRNEVHFAEIFKDGNEKREKREKADAVIYKGEKCPRNPYAIIEFKSDSRKTVRDMKKLIEASRSGLISQSGQVLLVCAGICYFEKARETFIKNRVLIKKLFNAEHVTEECFSCGADGGEYQTCAIGIEVDGNNLVQNAIYFATSPLSLPPPEELT